MKPYANLYQQIYDFDTLYTAYVNARDCKRYRNEVLDFTSDLEENLISLQNELIYKQYAVGRYREFRIFEPKERMIMALPFRDRVVQWAIYLVLNPIFLKGYIYDSHGCIPGKGSHSAVHRLKYWLQIVDKKPEKQFFLKLDVSKFYYRVDHSVLLEIFRRKIADDDVMWLLNEIINCEHTSFGLPAGLSISDTDIRLAEKGIPIGNLTSQMFANVYMNELDQYIKRELRVRHYIRYMDDMVILSDSKEELHRYQQLISCYLKDNLQLDLNNKTCIRPTSLGIDFLGYKVWSTHIKLRKSTSLRVKRHLKRLSEQYAAGTKNLEEIKEVVSSYHGMLKHCDSYNLRCKISDSFVLKRSSE